MTTIIQQDYLEEPNRHYFPISATLEELLTLEQQPTTIVDTSIFLRTRHKGIPNMANLLANHSTCFSIPEGTFVHHKGAMKRRLKLLRYPNLQVTQEVLQELEKSLELMRISLHYFNTQVNHQPDSHGTTRFLEDIGIKNSHQVDVTEKLHYIEACVGDFHKLFQGLHHHVYIPSTSLLLDVINQTFDSLTLPPKQKFSRKRSRPNFPLQEDYAIDKRIVSTATFAALNEKKPVLLVSGDKDFLQLLYKGVPELLRTNITEPTTLHENPISLYLPNTKHGVSLGKYYLAFSTNTCLDPKTFTPLNLSTSHPHQQKQ